MPFFTMITFLALECSLHIKELKELFPKHTWRKRRYFMEPLTLGLFRASSSLQLRLKVGSFFLSGKQEALEPSALLGHTQPPTSLAVCSGGKSGKKATVQRRGSWGFWGNHRGMWERTWAPPRCPQQAVGLLWNSSLLQTHGLFAQGTGTPSVCQGFKHICK